MVSAIKVRQGKATKLVIGNADDGACKLDGKLITLLAEAHAARTAVFAAPDCSIKQIATDRRICRHRFMRMICLSWLAPDIVVAIIDGRQPVTLTPGRLLGVDLPVDWASQRALLGFA